METAFLKNNSVEMNHVSDCDFERVKNKGWH